MGSGINYKINEFLCNSKNVKKRRNTRLEKCYGHVNIATAFPLFVQQSNNIAIFQNKPHSDKTELELRKQNLFPEKLVNLSKIGNLLKPIQM